MDLTEVIPFHELEIKPKAAYIVFQSKPKGGAPLILCQRVIRIKMPRKILNKYPLKKRQLEWKEQRRLKLKMTSLGES